ncbi:somatostatin-1A [Nematolebias whitei]|uniref:somatostatin-1A n=1 Tax=Nematolebias whitei TaxID=451745 RepID=UPI0018992E69|nr:somatostatin-1A [Nematolebias whitei]
MLHPQVWVLLVVSSLSGLLVPGGGEQMTEILREDFIKDQAPTRLLFLRFVSELMASRGETLRELEEEELGGGRERLRRRHLRFRQRKAGCRNFFWKSFTAC